MKKIYLIQIAITMAIVSPLSNASQVMLAGTPETGDYFGNAVASGDFNRDGYADVAIGVPGENGSNSNTGWVQVVYGSSQGITASSKKLSISPVGSTTHSTNYFGEHLIAGDFNQDGYADLAIQESIDYSGYNDYYDPVVIQIFRGSKDGFIYQQTLGTERYSTYIPYDQPVLASGDFNGDGYPDVYYNGNLYFSSNKFFNINPTQLSTPYINEAVTTGDFNDDQYDDIAIGMPRCTVSNMAEAGCVVVFYGPLFTFSQTFSKSSSYIEGDITPNDHFGQALAATDFNGDGYADLAIGSQMDNSSGAVNVIYGSSEGLSEHIMASDQIWGQSIADIEGKAENYDFFGSSLATGDLDGDGYNDLIIGVMGEDNDSGAINILCGSSNGLIANGNRLITQATSGIEGGKEWGDLFGYALTTGDFNKDGKADIVIGVPGESLDKNSNDGNYESAGAVNILPGTNNGNLINKDTDVMITQ